MPGSSKENSVINHVDSQILAINRRHAKKFSGNFADPSEADRDRGYESFREVVKDINAIIDILWVSATRMFSVLSRSLLAGPYMLTFLCVVV